MSSHHEARERALTTSEAVLWRAESPGLRLPVLAMLTLDGTPDRERLCQVLERTVRAHPELRSRLVDSSLAVGRPRWAPVDHLDVRHHLRVVRHPEPDDTDQVLDLVRAMAETPFDPARPLWECLLVQGTGTGRCTLAFKVHHALTDGLLIMRMLGTLCDDPDRDPDLAPDDVDSDRTTHTHRPDPQHRLRLVEHPGGTPHDPSAGFAPLSALPGTVLRGTWRAVGVLTERLLGPLAPLPHTVRSVPAAARSCAAALTLPAPHSPALAGRSAHRELRTVEVPRAALRAAGRLVGGTTHDAFLTGVLGGLRHYHQALGASWPRVPMAVAVALRADPGTRGGGNRFTGLRLAGPAGEPDPLRRLRAVHSAVRAARAGPLIDPDRLGPVSRLLAAAPGPAVQALTRLLCASDVHCTYVPGPKRRIRVAGVEVAAMHPFAPAVNCGFSTSMCSYDKTCAIGVNIDTKAVRHPELLQSALVTGLREVTGLIDE
jgi:WS/DGAT/MGAT family acyltransferase